MAEPRRDENTFSCHICLDQASEPVVTSCGHLFCWPCLHQVHHHNPIYLTAQWMGTGGNTCPVCKSGITREKLTPIYSRGREADPRESTPNRPPGHREPAEQREWGDPGFAQPNVWRAHVSLGPEIFGLFGGINFTSFGHQANAARPATPLTPEEEKQLFSKMTLFLGILVLAFILLM